MHREHSSRIYSLDALRAIMMLLGVVLHSAVTFTNSSTIKAVWPLQDPASSHSFFDLLVAFIHTFRMPVFFVASGFFGALLLYKKGATFMLMNRISRIVLPFLAGVIIIYPLIVFAFTFSASAFAGHPSPGTYASDQIISLAFFPFKTAHLWFLYYLAIFSLISWLLSRIMLNVRAFRSLPDKFITRILRATGYRLITVSLLFFCCLSWQGIDSIKTNTTFEIDLPVLVTYFLFYGLGWMIYRGDVLQKIKSFGVAQLLLGTVLFFILILNKQPGGSLMMKQGLAAASCACFIFGFLAVFQKHFHRYSSRLRYIMDASYWVYIIHLPIVAFIPGLMVDLPLAAGWKFLITFSTTTIICFLSYQFLVRSTVIGVFLNGKRERRISKYSVNKKWLPESMRR